MLLLPLCSTAHLLLQLLVLAKTTTCIAVAVAIVDVGFWPTRTLIGSAEIASAALATGVVVIWKGSRCNWACRMECYGGEMNSVCGH